MNKYTDELGSKHPGTERLMRDLAMVPHPQPTADGACTSAWEKSADAEVTPDPYDGVPADVLPDAERSINKVVHTLQYSNTERQAKAEYMARVDECRGNAKMLLDMGHLEAAQLLVTRADALIARVPK